MMETIAIALGGALGALARHWVGLFVTHYTGYAFPWATLVINIAGSLLVGVVYVLILDKTPLGSVLRSMWIIGFFGAFTTFSAFSLQTFNMIEDGRILTALGYIGISVCSCVLAAAAGLLTARQW